MKIGERGQVTAPKDISDQFGLGPETEVEFRVVSGSIVLNKILKKLPLAQRKGRCASTFAKLGYSPRRQVHRRRAWPITTAIELFPSLDLHDPAYDSNEL